MTNPAQKNPLWTKLRLLALVVLLLGAGACATAGTRTVTVLAVWTGNEETDFRTVLKAFTDSTGIEVDYEGTRALDQVLASDLQRGTPPDVAMLPSPGKLATYARAGKLKPLDALLGDQISRAYGPQWLNLEKAGTSRLYAVAVKADLKSAVWYGTAALPGPKPATWNDLVALSTGLAADGHTPWCLGMGDPPTSGWPGTDWIEDILLHTAGPDAYRRWAAGQLPWTSPQVRQAWADWGELVTAPGAVRGGTPAALLTAFGDAGRPLFARPPGCLLEHQASFAMGGYLGMKRADGTTPRPGTDFAFFPFPGPPVSEVSADFAGMLDDTPEAEALMKFLASDQAQRIWPAIHRGSVFSADRNVTGVYDDPVSVQVAATLTAPGRQVCLDASDLMPATMNGAFVQAVNEYLTQPAQLDTLLTDLDKVRLGAPGADWLNVPCGQ